MTLPAEIAEQILFYYLCLIDHIDDLINIQKIYPIWDHYLDDKEGLFDLVDNFIPTPQFDQLILALTKSDQKKSFMTLHLGRNLTELTPRLQKMETLLPEVSNADVFLKLFTHLTRKNKIYHFVDLPGPSRKNYDLIVFHYRNRRELIDLWNSMQKGQMVLNNALKTPVLNIKHFVITNTSFNRDYDDTMIEYVNLKEIILLDERLKKTRHEIADFVKKCQIFYQIYLFNK